MITVQGALALLSNRRLESVGQRAGETSQAVKGTQGRFRALAPRRRIQVLSTAGQVTRGGRAARENLGIDGIWWACEECVEGFGHTAPTATGPHGATEHPWSSRACRRFARHGHDQPTCVSESWVAGRGPRAIPAIG